jgi:3-hydroxyacyl-[acyl-carrier-protein] dehydratase
MLADMGAADREQGAEDFDILRIMEMIPHRYPFLMIDRVVDVTLGEKATGIKNVSISENYFHGHFPQRPMMPGMLIIEAMAQTAAVLIARTLHEERADKLFYFMSIDKGRFRRPVVPGDTLHLHVTCQHNRGNAWKFKGDAKVGGKTVADATFVGMITDAA